MKKAGSALTRLFRGLEKIIYAPVRVREPVQEQEPVQELQQVSQLRLVWLRLRVLRRLQHRVRRHLQQRQQPDHRFPEVRFRR
jgi:hypothetical protein